MKFERLDTLRRFLQTLAFCLVIAAIQVAFQPNIRYEGPLVYSLCIGVFSWGLIDLGRHAFPSSRESGWPQGPSGVALPLVGVLGGYFLGTLSADTWFGRSSWTGRGQSDVLGSVLVTAMAGTVITYYFYSKGKRADLERLTADAKAHAAESKLKLLETQIEPHMLFNTLANLRALIKTDPTAAVTMLDCLNDYLRATLAASRATMHPLQTEFDRLRDYLELMAVRMGPRLQFTLDLPGELAHLKVPTLLLQPVVENSIKHGLEPHIAGGSILVQARQLGAGQAAQLVLEVIDTGVGLNAKAARPGQQASTNFGLTQIRERLATAYGTSASLTLAANLPQGTRATVILPQNP